jgi:glycosyltransferase involved in cell wall biosynthesis
MLSSEHRYPMMTGVSFGPHPKIFSSGSGHHLHDLLAKGLAEFGHEVLYWLPFEPAGPLPPGVRWISEPDASADIHHDVGVGGEHLIEFMKSRGKPSVSTCHLDRSTLPEPRCNADRRWIYVSKTLARSHNSARYVLNGLDPSNYRYSAAKQEYFLFMSAVERAWGKGLKTAFRLAQWTGIRLVVAGTASEYSKIHEMARVCRENGAEYVGDVQGSKKADLFASAKAFLFPTDLNEAFGLVMVEALLSGTPVICSDKGACPEVIGSEAGFVCREWDDYVAAVERLGEIRPQDCLRSALDRFHYHCMTTGYIREYEAEIAGDGPKSPGELCITAS